MSSQVNNRLTPIGFALENLIFLGTCAVHKLTIQSKRGGGGGVAPPENCSHSLFALRVMLRCIYSHGGRTRPAADEEEGSYFQP